jgi:hypothetical protein
LASGQFWPEAMVNTYTLVYWKIQGASINMRYHWYIDPVVACSH